MKVTAKSDSEDVRIYLNGLLHIRFPRDKNTQVQSWMETHKKLYVIQITAKKHTQWIEHEDKNIWEIILKLLDKHL